MTRLLTATSLTAAALALTAATATAGSMHPNLGARLAGMGEHGVVNLHLTSSSGKICWTFDVPTTTAATRASVHVGQTKTVLFELGMHYTKHGCMKTSAMNLEHLESTPGKYAVWVDTKAHTGELRGKLFAGMAHM